MTAEPIVAQCTDCWGGMRYRRPKAERPPLGPLPPAVIYLPAQPIDPSWRMERPTPRAPEDRAEASRPG
jgi:hypothetical protein